METLDQLLRGDIASAGIGKFCPDDTAFFRGVLGLLSGDDVALLTADRTEVPRWRGGKRLKHGGQFRLQFTEQGGRRIS